MNLPDEMVDRAAKALWGVQRTDTSPDWSNLGVFVQQIMRNQTRAALEAALEGVVTVEIAAECERCLLYAEGLDGRNYCQLRFNCPGPDTYALVRKNK